MFELFYQYVFDLGGMFPFLLTSSWCATWLALTKMEALALLDC